jgi:hypothetical protein
MEPESRAKLAKQQQPIHWCNVCDASVQLSHIHSISVQKWNQHLSTEKHKKAAAAQKCLQLVADSAKNNNTAFINLFLSSASDGLDNDALMEAAIPMMSDLSSNLLDEEIIERTDIATFFHDSDASLSFEFEDDYVEDRYAPLLKNREPEQDLTLEESDSIHYGSEDEVYFGPHGISRRSPRKESISTSMPHLQRMWTIRLLRRWVWKVCLTMCCTCDRVDLVEGTALLGLDCFISFTSRTEASRLRRI